MARHRPSLHDHDRHQLDQHNIRRGFRQITKAAGLGEEWVPRELRHTFVSIMSAGDVPVEEIARLAGHQQTSTTEVVYRRELRPVITTGAKIMEVPPSVR
ncbi:MAG: tyrosine-type recombinase/integrase [Streptosporangiaceae bacterium]